MAKQRTAPTRHYFWLGISGRGADAKRAKFSEFLSDHSWPRLDYVALVVIADSSLELTDFREWVSNETGVDVGDLVVEEITRNSKHEDERDLIRRYFKVSL